MQDSATNSGTALPILHHLKGQKSHSSVAVATGSNSTSAPKLYDQIEFPSIPAGPCAPKCRTPRTATPQPNDTQKTTCVRSKPKRSRNVDFGGRKALKSGLTPTTFHEAHIVSGNITSNIAVDASRSTESSSTISGSFKLLEASPNFDSSDTELEKMAPIKKLESSPSSKQESRLTSVESSEEETYDTSDVGPRAFPWSNLALCWTVESLSHRTEFEMGGRRRSLPRSLSRPSQNESDSSRPQRMTTNLTHFAEDENMSHAAGVEFSEKDVIVSLKKSIPVLSIITSSATSSISATCLSLDEIEPTDTKLYLDHHTRTSVNTTHEHQTFAGSLAVKPPTSFECQYCLRQFVPTVGRELYLCPGCGPDGLAPRYCSVACLLVDAYGHARTCACYPSHARLFKIPFPNAYCKYEEHALFNPLQASETAELYRQRMFSLYCRYGPFPKLAETWCIRNPQYPFVDMLCELEKEKMTGIYHIFESGMIRSGLVANPSANILFVSSIPHLVAELITFADCYSTKRSSHQEHPVTNSAFALR